MSNKLFSGPQSEVFWDAVNEAEEEAGVLYDYGCLAQTIESERDDLAILVRRLVRVVTKTDNGNDVANKALDYLKRKRLLGSPLRGD